MPNKYFAAVLGFLCPPVAFIYLARLQWAIFYFLVSTLLGLADFHLEKYVGYAGLGMVLAVVCCAHAFNASKETDFGDERKWYSKWWGVLLIPAVFASGVFALRAFLYEPFQIPSSSMSPTLAVGDHILISKYGYGLYGSFDITVYNAAVDSRKKPKRGDVFVLYPPQGDRLYVERIIGLPNDVVEFSDKQLYVNGKKVDTQRINDSNIYRETIDEHTYSVQYLHEANRWRNVSVKVPEDAYFVMGDNRDNSADSRVWGTVPAENIVGKLVFAW